MNSGGRLTAANTACLLATQSAQSGRNVVLCDTTGQVENEIKAKTSTEGSTFSIQNIDDNLSAIMDADGSSFFTSTTFNTTITDLSKSFDQVFVCTSNRNAQLGLMALLEFAPSVVMISGLRKTKKSDIKNTNARLPIDLLFHD